MPISFFPPALFERDRDVIRDIFFEVGTAPGQQFAQGVAVAELERQLAEEAGARHAVACGNATGALVLILDALGIGAGDEVIVPAYGCQPLADTVVNRGATPVFVDVHPRTLVIEPAAVESAMTARTAAIMPAHVFCAMADMPALMEVARRHGVAVVEDAAVAQGATLDGVAAGSWGHAGVYSFSQFKPLGSIGEGGVVLTGDDEIARQCGLRRGGSRGASSPAEVAGRGSGMDEVLARFLLHRRPGLAGRLRRKVEIAKVYQEAFGPLAAEGLLTLPPLAAEESWCHVYALQTDRRDDLRAHLAARGVGTHVYYPVPLPHQPAFVAYARGVAFRNADAVGRRNLALPVWPGLTEADIAHITDAVIDFFRAVPRR